MMRKETSAQTQKCIWCGRLQEDDDHIFPRGLGGTLQLSVPACRECQTQISRAELEVARRSEFALYRLDKGPPRRKKGRADSGSLEAVYALVPDDRLGGYMEVAFRAKEHPITLPSIELDVNSGKARCHGAKPEDIDRLVEAVLAVTSGPPNEAGVLGSVDGDLLREGDAPYVHDSSWWPRVFLDLKGRLGIRARDGSEAEQFFAALVALLQSGAFTDHSEWGTGEILAGTPHRVRLQYDRFAVPRVVAKIAYATAYRKALPQILESESLRALSRFVRGKQGDDYLLPVRSISDVGSFAQWPDYHLVLIESRYNTLLGAVVLYGACFLVDLGENPLPEVFAKPVVAMSSRDGTNTFWAEDDLAKAVAETLRDHIEQLRTSKRA